MCLLVGSEFGFLCMEEFLNLFALFCSAGFSFSLMSIVSDFEVVDNQVFFTVFHHPSEKHFIFGGKMNRLPLTNETKGKGRRRHE